MLFVTIEEKQVQFIKIFQMKINSDSIHWEGLKSSHLQFLTLTTSLAILITTFSNRVGVRISYVNAVECVSRNSTPPPNFS